MWKKKKRFNNFDLNLRYCPENEVHEKMSKFLSLKWQLALRLKHMKDCGNKLISIYKWEKWIETNYDMLSKDDDLNKIFRNVKSGKNINNILASKSPGH